MPPRGFEPPTPGLGNLCSIQLSYEGGSNSKSRYSPIVVKDRERVKADGVKGLRAMREIHREIVGAIVLDSSGAVLLGRKNQKLGGVYLDCWHSPGGGIEAGESHLEALRRELLEEIGLEIGSSPQPLLDDQGRASTEKRLPSGEVVVAHMLFFMYQVQLDDDKKATIGPSEELPELRWFSREELPSIKLTPPGTELFRRLGWI